MIGRHVHWSDLDDAPIFAAIRERIANVEARIVHPIPKVEASPYVGLLLKV